MLPSAYYQSNLTTGQKLVCPSGHLLSPHIQLLKVDCHRCGNCNRKLSWNNGPPTHACPTCLMKGINHQLCEDCSTILRLTTVEEEKKEDEELDRQLSQKCSQCVICGDYLVGLEQHMLHVGCKPRVMVKAKRKKDQVKVSQKPNKKQDAKKKSESPNFDFNFISWNPRWMANPQKAALVLSTIKSLSNNSLGLVHIQETHMQAKVDVKSARCFQTQASREGGLWQAHFIGQQHKQIKAIGENILWVINNMGNRPIHSISVYCTPNDTAKANFVIRNLRWIVSELILKRDSRSLIIVSGDLNSIAMKKTSWLEQAGLAPVIPANEATHNRGGHLDQIWTNITVKGAPQVIEAPCGISDHRVLMVNLSINADVQALRFDQQNTFHTMQDVRNKCSEKAFQDQLAIGMDLNKPLSVVLANLLPKRKPLQQWYSAVPDWYWNAIDEQEAHIAERIQGWRAALREIEDFVKANDLKKAFIKINQITKLSAGPKTVRCLLVDDVVIADQDSVNAKVRAYFASLYKAGPKEIFHDAAEELKSIEVSGSGGSALGKSEEVKLFSMNDIEEAIKGCNFSKALGPDEFDGLLLRRDEIRQNVIRTAVNWLNSGIFPQFLRESRLVLLSKSGSQQCTLDQIRPIMVLSHLTKILEKAILLKLKELQSELFATQDYQAGFKEKTSTHRNLSIVINQILMSRVKRSQRRIYITVDLQKAYDNVDLVTLFHTLSERIKSPEEGHIVNLIKRLYENRKVWLKDLSFAPEKGVMQGSCISPFLFNVMLEHALNSKASLRKAIEEGKLICFADDILLMPHTTTEASVLLKDIESLESLGLKINKNKTKAITDIPDIKVGSDIEGIQVVDRVKYLGMDLACDRKLLIKMAKSSCKRYLHKIRGKIQVQDERTNRIVLSAFYRSLMVYYLTPLVAAGAMGKDEIEKFEASFARKQGLAPNDIKSDVINHVADNFTVPVFEVIQKLATSNRLFVREEMKAPVSKIMLDQLEADPNVTAEAYQKRDALKQRYAFSVEMQSLMLAISQKRTCLHWKQVHFCKTHGKQVDAEHIDNCEHLLVLYKPTHFNEVMESNRLFDNEESVLAEMWTHFDQLLTIISQLEAAGTYGKISQLKEVPAIPVPEAQQQ